MRRTKKKKSLTTAFFITVFIAVFLFAMDLGGFLAPVRNMTDIAFNPVRFWFYRQSRVVSTFFRDISSISSLREDNMQLRSEILEFESIASENEEYKRENEVLRAQLNIFPELDYELVQADIIGGDLKSLNVETLIINKGTDSGVNEGSIVIYAGYLVGQVVSTTRFSAEVQLLTSSGTNIPAISEKNRTKGIITGDVNTGLSMTRILREEKIELDEKILTSGMGTFPKGLIIGEVAQIEGNDSDVEQKALIKKYLDIQTIEEVFVIDVRKD